VTDEPRGEAESTNTPLRHKTYYMKLENILSPERITFKKVLPEDWEKFREIRLKMLRTDPQAFESTYAGEAQKDESFWKARLSSPDRYFYAAEEDAQFVAIVGARKNTEDDWSVIAVYTCQEFRGKHLSQKLMQQVIQEARVRGAKKVSGFVSVRQEDAISLYKNMGVEVVRTEKNIKMGDGKMYDEYYMEKTLDPQASK
jgi:ribosomal protein S18 acetylase RimI-like enzyme